MEQPNLDVQLPQTLPGEQNPSMGAALPGVPPNATTPPTGQPPRPPLPSEPEMEQPSPVAQQPQQPPSRGIGPEDATPNFGRSVNPRTTIFRWT